MSGAWVYVVSLLLLLGNAFFVGAEFAAMAVRRSTLEPLADAGSKRAAACLAGARAARVDARTAQLGITVCSVGLGALAEAALHHLLEPIFHGWGLSDAWAGGVALALALLIVVLPARRRRRDDPQEPRHRRPRPRRARARAAALLPRARLRHIVSAMETTAKWLVRLFGIEPKDEIASAFTAEEVAHIVGESRREGLIEEERHGLVSKTLEFSDKLAHEVAVALDALTTVRLGATPADIERLVAKQGFSRYPVRDAADEIAGYLHLKDVLYADDERHELPVPPEAHPPARHRPRAATRSRTCSRRCS